MTRQISAAALITLLFVASAGAEVTKYVRYESGGKISYGVLEGDTIRELSGDLFASPAPTGTTLKLAAGKLLFYAAPGQPIFDGPLVDAP